MRLSLKRSVKEKSEKNYPDGMFDIVMEGRQLLILKQYSSPIRFLPVWVIAYGRFFSTKCGTSKGVGHL